MHTVISVEVKYKRLVGERIKSTLVNEEFMGLPRVGDFVELQFPPKRGRKKPVKESGKVKYIGWKFNGFHGAYVPWVLVEG